METKKLKSDNNNNNNQSIEEKYKNGEEVKNVDLSVGRPRYRPESSTFYTKGGIFVTRSVEKILPEEIDGIFARLALDLDTIRGGLFQSAYEFPGRYSRWSVGFKNPPLVMESRCEQFNIIALNERGLVMLPWIQEKLKTSCGAAKDIQLVDNNARLTGKINPVEGKFAEEDRSKQNSTFSVVRSIIELFATTTEIDPQLGFYGAFGYDLVSLKNLYNSKFIINNKLDVSI